MFMLGSRLRDMSYGYLGLRGLWLVICRCGEVKVDWP